MKLRAYFGILSILALASCGELITTEPPQPKSDNSSYGWTAAAGASVLRGPDGSGRRIVIDGGNLIDSNASGVDTLFFGRFGDSVIVRGLTPHSFLPLPNGASIESDTDFTSTNYPATALLPESDTAIYASGSSLMVYDGSSDAVSVRYSFPARVQFLERAASVWYAITDDSHLWVSINRGFKWIDKGTIPTGPVRAVEGSQYGTLYIATPSSIERFDGQNWNTVASVGHPINTLKYFSPGPPSWTIYAGTDDGYVLTISSTGSVQTDPMQAGGQSIAITAIAFEFGGGPGGSKVLAVGRGAAFEGHLSGSGWQPVKDITVDATTVYVDHDDVLIGTQDGKIVVLHDDGTHTEQTLSDQPVSALSGFNGELQAIAGGVLFTAGKQHSWTASNTAIREPHAHLQPWVFLTKDSLWTAANVKLSGVSYTYMGRVLDHAPELKLHGREHKDILVVRYAVESGSYTAPTLDTTDVPMYVVYFEHRHGPVRIEVIQKDKPEIIEEVD